METRVPTCGLYPGFGPTMLMSASEPADQAGVGRRARPVTPSAAVAAIKLRRLKENSGQVTRSPRSVIEKGSVDRERDSFNGAVRRGQVCPRHTTQRLLPTFGRNDPVHPEIFDQLSIVIPSVYAVLERHAQPGSGAFRPRGDRRRWDRDVLIINRASCPMHVGERALQVDDDLRLSAYSVGSILGAANIYRRFFPQDPGAQKIVVGSNVAKLFGKSANALEAWAAGRERISPSGHDLRHLNDAAFLNVENEIDYLTGTAAGCRFGGLRMQRHSTCQRADGEQQHHSESLHKCSLKTSSDR